MSDKIYIPARQNTKELTSLLKLLVEDDKEFEKLWEIFFEKGESDE